ncbi:MAG: hypothetical protein C0397_12035 [Odoribacter sp.]|nr:hypothetical protein [Odoribacter sp.]
MRKFCFLTFYFSIVFVSYSNGIGSTKKPDYARVLNQSICRLNSHPDNQRAKKKVQDIYTQALNYYQHEIDRILMSDDSFKWTKTLDVLEEINGLSDEIRYNSAASQLICEPRIYTSELTDAKEKASAELYSAGISRLNQHSKEKAKEAFHYFVEASKLNPEYKEVRKKVLEAKDLATYKVAIEPIYAYTQNGIREFSTKTFTQTLILKLREEFTANRFVFFYTSEEAKKQGFKNPDLTVFIEMSDFELSSKVIHYGGEVVPNPSHVLKLIDGKYVWEKYVGPPNNRISNLKTRSELYMKANTVLKIGSVPDHVVVFKERIPWNYLEDVNYEFKSEVNQTKVSNSPDLQIFFDHFSLSLCDPLVYRISDFF